MSIIALLIMATLFLSETLAFAKSNTFTQIFVDDQAALQPQIRLNFDLSFYALPCEYLSVDVLDSLGANRQNITKNIEKWHLDDMGEERGFHGHNTEQKEIKHDEDHPSENDAYDWIPGDTPENLTTENFESFIKEHPAVFVNFFAPWCVWCQRLHPTWESLAKEIKGSDLKLAIAMVDCVANQDLCQRNSIRAFPTLRWFENGRQVDPEYRGDRTVNALVSFSTVKVKTMKTIKDPHRRMKENLHNYKTQEGCRVSGHLMVNRVPGNFHVEARSNAHNLNIAMTNLTHTINHLSFGNKEDFTSVRSKRVLKHFPLSSRQFNPLDDTTYKTQEYHKAFHHNLKVVSTTYNVGPGASASGIFAYQILAQSQLVEYDVNNVPEARFSYDISPMGVGHSKKARMWYDYITSLLAIIGGTFTTLGLIDASLYRIFKSKKL